MKESEQLDHVVHGLVQVYEHDNRISPDLPEEFTPEKVCRFTFFNVLQSVRTREDDCGVLFSMLERTLYKDRSDGRS